MSDYTPTGAPADQTRGASATIRSEFQAVATAIATKSDTAGETYSGTHDFTGGAVIVATQASSDTSTKSASTEFVQNVVLMAGIDPIAHQIATQFEMENGTEAALRLMSPLRVKQAIAAIASMLGHTHTGTYEPVQTAATQAEMENGTEAAVRSMSPLRVKQAIAAIASMPGHTHTGTYEPVQTAATQAEMVGGTVSAVRSMSPLRIKQAMVVGYVARTANTMLAAGDLGKFIDITSGTFTQTFDAAATLGGGWWCYIRNIGTGDITLDPNASETIDGVTSGLIVPGDMYTIFCDGSGFVTERRCAGPMLTLLKTSSGSWTVPLGVRKVKATVVGGGGGCKSSSSPGYAGGGGGTAIKTYAVAPGATCTYTVGAAGSIAYSGTAGGNSTFTYSSTTITGSGGTIDNATGGNLSAGGGASGGDVNLPGRAGLPITGTTSSNANIAGCSAFGFGGISRNDSNTNYGVATGYGGGSPGSGGGHDINATAGCVIIEY